MNIKIKWNDEILDNFLYNKDETSATVEANISKWPVVPNLIRCYSWFDHRQGSFVTAPCKPNSNSENIIKIAFVVESPHSEEFTANFSPLRPLNGTSGSRFDNHIEEKMYVWAMKQSATYEIKIFNPVQYQTSLCHFLSNKIPYDQLFKRTSQKQHSIPRYGGLHNTENSKLRNQVWKLLFTDTRVPCQSDFLKQLSTYEPQYIVNACTGSSGMHKNAWCKITDIFKRPPSKSLSQYSCGNLKTIVRRFVYDNFKSISNVNYREELHPENWV